MRIIALLFFIIRLQAIGQEPQVVLNHENSPLSTILEDIRSQSGVKLAYDARNLRSVKRSIVLGPVSVSQALDSLVSGIPYDLAEIKGTWLIIPRSSDSRATEESASRRNFSIGGRLLNAETGEGLAYASLSLKGSTKGTMSNLHGYFSLARIPIDTLPLCISYVGFRSRCIDLRKHASDNLQIKLEPMNTYLVAVDVIGEQQRQIHDAPMQELTKLDARMLQRTASTAHADLFQTIQLLPGVSSNDVLDSQLHIRGSEEDENLVLWDGFTLYHLDHFFGAFSTLNHHAIKDINLIKGPYASRYGGRSGGVLELTGKSGDRSGPHFSLYSDLIDAGVLFEGPIGKKSSYLISFRRSHTDLFENPYFDRLLDRIATQSTIGDVNSRIDEEQESVFRYHDLNIKWSTEFNQKDRLQFTLFNGGDRFQRESNRLVDPLGDPFSYRFEKEDDSEWGNTGLGLVWSRNDNQKKEVYTSLGYSDFQSRYHFLDTERDFLNQIQTAQRLQSDQRTNQLEDLNFQHRRIIKNQSGVRYGFGYQFNSIGIKSRSLERNFALQQVQFKERKESTEIHSLYIDRQSNQEKTWSTRVGLRASLARHNEQIYVEPRMRLNRRLNKKTSLHLAGGYYVQIVRRVAEQNLFLRQPDQWLISDQNNIPESQVWHSSLSLKHDNGPLAARLEFFYKNREGVILNTLQNRLLASFSTESSGLVHGDGHNYGLDLLLSWDKKAHSAWLSYSYTLSENRIEAVDDGRIFPSTFNKPHDAKFVYTYRWRDYQFQNQIMASSGYPYTPLLGSFRGPGGDPFLIYGDELSARLEHRFRWDASISRSFSKGLSDLHLSLGVFNITDHRNIKSRSYDIVEGPNDELIINTVDLDLLGISPTFSLRLDIR